MATKALSKYNAAVQSNSGRVGNVRYYTRGGNTYTRSTTVSSKVNSRTDAQMRQRLSFVSLNHFYTNFGKMLRGAFQYKQGAQSDFNLFMQANQGLGVYFSKDENRKNYCVTMPLTISSGSLDTITPAMNSDKTYFVTGIQTGKSDASATFATIKELSQALVSSNSKYSYGDTLTIFTFKNVGNEITVATEQVTLSKNDTTAYSGSLISINGVIAVPYVAAGGCAIVHMDENKKVSTSVIALGESAQLDYEGLREDDVFQLARDTYGSADETYLAGGETEEETTVVTITTTAANFTSESAAASAELSNTPSATNTVYSYASSSNYLAIGGSGLSGLSADNFSSATSGVSFTVVSKSATRAIIQVTGASSNTVINYNGTGIAKVSTTSPV